MILQMEDTIKAKTVEAQSIRLTDPNDNVVAELSARAGSSLLIFSDNTGRPRLGLGFAGQSQRPGLALFHEHGGQRLSIEIDDDGKASIRLFDLHGNCRMFVAVSGDGMTTMGFADANGKPLVSMGATPSDGVISLTNSDGSKFWEVNTESG